jgi:PAS domain S-box-containing protein
MPMHHSSQEVFNPLKYPPLMPMAIIIGLAMFVWAFYSGQQLLRQQAPLVDNIMQLRVDLAQSHLLIDESNDGTHHSLDQKHIDLLINKLKQQSNMLYQGNVQMGDIHDTVTNIPALQEQLKTLKQSIDELSVYIHKNYAQLQNDNDLKMQLDGHFAISEGLANQFDQYVHRSIQQSLQQQKTLFLILLSIGMICIGILFYLLKRSQQSRLLALQKTTWLSQALEHSGEAVIIANVNAQIEFVNDAFCQMTGYSSHETLGNNPSMLSSGKQNKPFYDKLWQTIKNGNVWRGELTNKKKDGSLYPALMTIAPIFNAQGELTHYVANQRDISEHKMLEEQVFQAQKMEAIGTLTAGIAHDFNNTLTGISGNIYLLKKPTSDAKKTAKRLDSMQKICDSAATHIKQLLSYARNDSILMTSIEMNQCILNACQMANLMMPATVNLKFVSHEKDLHVHWNEAQVQQILINLINNARHALQGTKSPSITLEIGIINNQEGLMENNLEMTDDRYLCLSIQDNGCGMTREVLEHVFEPFFTAKSSDEGTGLGLSMAYGAIKQAGGDLTVESHPGKGTTFKIYFPIDVEFHPESIIEEDKLYKGHGETILIADDEKPLTQIQKSIIESFGYKVLVAYNGLEAVEIFEKHADQIKLVILDLVMPELTGMQAAKNILSHKPDTNIIFSTAYDIGQSLEDNHGDIHAPVIYKPYQPETISRLIYEQINATVFRFNT